MTISMDAAGIEHISHQRERTRMETDEEKWRMRRGIGQQLRRKERRSR